MVCGGRLLNMGDCVIVGLKERKERQQVQGSRLSCVFFLCSLLSFHRKRMNFVCSLLSFLRGRVKGKGACFFFNVIDG